MGSRPYVQDRADLQGQSEMHLTLKRYVVALDDMQTWLLHRQRPGSLPVSRNSAAAGCDNEGPVAAGKVVATGVAVSGTTDRTACAMVETSKEQVLHATVSIVDWTGDKQYASAVLPANIQEHSDRRKWPASASWN